MFNDDRKITFNMKFQCVRNIEYKLTDIQETWENKFLAYWRSIFIDQVFGTVQAAIIGNQWKRRKRWNKGTFEELD